MTLFFGRRSECALTYGQSRIVSAGILVLALAAALPARAERALPLEEALQLARQNNRDLRVARARLEESKSGVEVAIAQLLPTTGLQGTYTHNYKNVTFSNLFPVSTFTSLDNPITGMPLLPASAIAGFNKLSDIYVLKGDALAGGVNVNVPIIVPGAYANLTSAKSTYAASEANFHVSETAVLYSTAQAFFAAAGADELLQARHHAVEVARVTLTNAQSRFQAGTVNKTEVTRASLAELNAEQAQLESIDMRDQAYRSLATILGLREPFRVEAPEPNTQPRQEAAPETLAQEAQSLRPEFAAYDASRRAAHDEVLSNGLKWLPSVSGFGNAQLFNYAGFTGDKYAWALGLQLNWTIYDGGIRDAQRHQASAQEIENELQLAQLHDTVEDDITTASRTLSTKRVALDTARKAVALSNETLDLLRAQYDAGTATQLDVLQAQDALVGSEVQQAQARFDLALADLTLQRNAGTFPAERARP